MIFRVSIIFLMSVLLVIPACSIFQEAASEDKNETEVYVFDEVTEEDTNETETVIAPATPYYIVQIGAFTTKDKADAFAEESRMLIENKVEVKYSNSVNLYVVQVKPYFKTRSDAEIVRNKLWQINGYQDAWIITVQ